MPQARRPLLRTVALLAVLALVLAACGKSSKKATATGSASGGGGGVKCSGIAIGFFGALTGDNANLGVNIMQGAKLAVDQFNKANADCQVGFKKFDSQGSPDQAPALAQQAVQDKELVGLVGPAFSGESKAADPLFNEAGLPIITPSATNPKLAENGWKIFHRAVGNDASQGPAAANYITNELKGTKVAVLDDASEYGKGIADLVRQRLGAKAVVSDSIDPKAQDYSATVSKVAGASPDVVYFGGYYAQAGLLVKQLRDKGLKATFVSDDGTNDPGFIKAAGAASDGSIVTCPCAPISEVKGGSEFKDAYKAAFSQDAGTYSPEAYDSANAFLEAIKAGNTTRQTINDYLNSKLDFAGITKTLKFDAKGEISEITVYAYKVQGGTIVPVGPVKG